MMRRISILAGLVCGLLLAQSSFGQGTSGTILGTVSDSTGAVIPGTVVTVRNVETGITRSVTTDGAGRYRASQLPVGDYEVTAESAGFQTVVRSGITLTVGREAVVDFALQVGAVAERITVTGEAPLVETTTSSVSQVMQGESIREVPLNGRSFDELALLQPGVFLTRDSQSSTGYGQANRRLSMAGSRANANVVLLDGTNINAFWNRGGGGLAGQQLGVDAIREFRLITSTSSAEYGRSAGGVMNVVTLSGTNEFHGSAFEFLRNNVMDARKFTDFNAAGRPPFKRNQFGASLGGPIVRDRTFFFGTWEGLRERIADSVRNFVPTAEARLGILPTSKVTVSEAVKPFLALYPAPNGPEQTPRNGTAEFNTTSLTTSNEDFFQIRIDHQFSENHSLFGRYTFDDGNIFNNTGLGIFPTSADSRNQYLTLQHMAILSPTVLNTLRAGFNRSFAGGQTQNDPAILRFSPVAVGIGSLSIGGGVASLGQSIVNTPFEIIHNLFEYSDDVAITAGSHSLKFGGLVSRIRDKFQHYFQVNGNYTFQSLSNFLQNRPGALTFGLPGSDPTAYWQMWLFGFYIQDDLRATDRLTLNLGIRYEPATNPINANVAHNKMVPVGPIDPLRDTNYAWTEHVFAENPSLRNLSPRFGFAWDVFGNGSTAVRGGFGIVYEPVLQHYFAMNVNDPPASLIVTKNSPTGFPNPLTAFPVVKSADLSVGVAMAYNYGRSPQVLQYSLNVQRELPGNMAMNLGYVGSKGNYIQYSANVNAPWPATDATGRKYTPKINGVPAPRRNPNLGPINFGYGGGNSWYNALQLSLQKRLSHGFSYGLSYTWSKNIDTWSGQRNQETANSGGQTVQDPDCIACGRSLSDFDIRHGFSLNYTYELPFGPNRTLGGNLTGLAGKLLGGWELAGIVKASAGLTFYPQVGFDHRGNWGEQGLSWNNLRPDQRSGYTTENTVIKDAQWDGRGFLQYYDPNAFVLQPPGYYGTLGRNTFFGPGSVTWDFSLVKNTTLGEGKRLQFRAEAFNALNQVILGFRPNTTAFNNATGVPPANSGRITSVRDARQIQLGLKLTF